MKIQSLRQGGMEETQSHLIGGADPQLAGAGEDGVLEIGHGLLVGGDRDPLVGSVQALVKQRDANTVGTQLAIENIDIGLEAVFRCFRRHIPVGDDDTTEGIGRTQRHERQRVQRGPPQEAVNPDRRTHRPAPVRFAEKKDAVIPEQASIDGLTGSIQLFHPVKILSDILFESPTARADSPKHEGDAKGREEADSQTEGGMFCQHGLAISEIAKKIQGFPHGFR